MLISCKVMTNSLAVGPPHYGVFSADVGFKGRIILLAELGFGRKADTWEAGPPRNNLRFGALTSLPTTSSRGSTKRNPSDVQN